MLIMLFYFRSVGAVQSPSAGNWVRLYKNEEIMLNLYILTWQTTNQSFIHGETLAIF